MALGALSLHIRSGYNAPILLGDEPDVAGWMTVLRGNLSRMQRQSTKYFCRVFFEHQAEALHTRQLSSSTSFPEQRGYLGLMSMAWSLCVTQRHGSGERPSKADFFTP